VTTFIRRARPDEADALTALARRAKGSWGYPPDWMAAWQDELTITPEYVTVHHVFVAEELEHPSGMAAIEIAGRIGTLEHVWVEPDLQGTGIGRALVQHALQAVGREGCSRVKVASDPGAGAFYQKLGATPAGRFKAPMPGAAERFLPVFEFTVDIVEARESKCGRDPGS
jgi:predicted N-acetyltransferase YhbS